MAAQIIPFRRPPAIGKPEAPRYAAGVAPFDPTNPVHVSAWNAIWRLGMLEAQA